MRRSKVIVGVCGDVVPQVAMVGPAQASKGPARRSCQSRTAGPQKTEQHCFVAPVWTALRVRSSVPLRAQRGAYIQQRECSGAARLPVRVLPSRVPVETTGTIAPLAALSVAI